jgi:hypothetical protein
MYNDVAILNTEHQDRMERGKKKKQVHLYDDIYNEN